MSPARWHPFSLVICSAPSEGRKKPQTPDLVDEFLHLWPNDFSGGLQHDGLKWVKGG